MTNRMNGIEESFKIGGHVYDIVENLNGYAIRLTKPDGSYIFLREPESHYETPSGARYAILLDLETRLEKAKHVGSLQRIK